MIGVLAIELKIHVGTCALHKDFKVVKLFPQRPRVCKRYGYFQNISQIDQIITQQTNVGLIHSIVFQLSLPCKLANDAIKLRPSKRLAFLVCAVTSIIPVDLAYCKSSS